MKRTTSRERRTEEETTETVIETSLATWRLL